MIRCSVGNQLLRLSMLVVVFALTSDVYSQRIVRELESNSGDSFEGAFERDTIGMGNDDEEKENIKVPVDVKSWTIDGKYGNIVPAIVDTLHHQYQNNNLSEGMNGHFNHLGNLGSPRINRIFYERQDEHQFMFINPMDQFFVDTDKFKFYNTKSPFMNVAYNTCGSKTTGDDHVKVTFARNVNKSLNFGAIFDYMYGQGYYANQST